MFIVKSFFNQDFSCMYGILLFSLYLFLINYLLIDSVVRPFVVQNNFFIPVFKISRDTLYIKIVVPEGFVLPLDGQMHYRQIDGQKWHVEYTI